MRIIKPIKQSLLFRSYQHQGRCYFSAAVLSMFPLDDSVPALIPENELWQAMADALGEGAAIDMCMPKPRGEVLVYGSFHAPQGKPVTAGYVRVRAGQVDKRINVFGDRYWIKSAGAGLGISDPLPLLNLPITFDHAFGGANYERNPLGKGIAAVKTETGDRIPLPNLELPHSLIAAPGDRPEPASFGPIDQMWPQRLPKAGTYDDNWIKTRAPGLADDIDWEFFNVAAQDQWLPEFFTGDESIEVWNMHPELPHLKAGLPAIRSRCFIRTQQGGDTQFRELDTHPDTLVLLPGVARGVIIWRGTTEITTDDASDISEILVGYENLADDPRPVAHYEAALHKRLDPDRGYLYLLNERDLIAEGDRSGLQEILDKEQAASSDEKLLQANIQAKAERQQAELRDKLAALGLDPDKYQPTPAPLSPDMQAAANLDLENIDLERLMAETRQQAEEAQAAVMQRAREQAGPEADLTPKPAPLPRPPGSQVLAEIRALVAIQPVLGEKFNLPALEEKFKQTEAAFLQGYRFGAHTMVQDFPSERQETAASAGREINESKPGTDFSNRDLAGAYCADKELRDLKLAGAFLEFADFSGATLTNVDFTEAVLTRANFCRAHLVNCKFSAANTGAADFTSATVEDCNFSNAIISEAKFTKAKLLRCDFSEAQAMQVGFSGAALTASRFSKVILIECDMHEANLGTAEINEAMFVKCRLEKANLGSVQASATLFVESNLNNTDCKAAQMPNVRMLAGTTLQGANFERADISKANFRGTVMPGACLREVQMDGSDFSECDLQNADLYRVVGRQAKFMKANLGKANMVAANLMEAMLDKAHLVETDLRGSNLYGAELMGVTVGKTRFDQANLKMTKFKDWRPS